MNSNLVRSKFLNFFKNKNHKIVKSAPMVIKNDPTLMFANAGMNQFKDNFLGNSISKDKRVVDTQKCLRVSGKHNDLEEVGIDTYHHTMFEMLGNWSFGDYFKKEAINWAWELLTEVYKIDKESLYVTVFEGSKDDETLLDQEAYDIWSEVVEKDKIILGNKADNFWEMGDTGPCGPCSEIHVDIRSKKDKALVPGKNLVNKDHPGVIEIWNLVFIQFNRKKDGSLENLPLKHIDTGMGFERLCMVLQGVTSNYDTDVFSPLIKELELLTDLKYGENKKNDIAIRVIVDHLRAVAFSIADGQLPSNNGAGYVIRRILRRAVRYGYTFLDLKTPFIYKLVKCLSVQFETAFPEIKDQVEIIENVIKEEELSFLRTLEKGILKLNEIILKSNNKLISGSDVFELYDTFGFPKDLTALILRENDMNFNSDEFKSLMKIQKNRSKSAINSSNEEWVRLLDSDQTEFVGYDKLNVVTKLVRYRKSISKKGSNVFQLVFDKTPFYAQGGGQLGDVGMIESFDNEKIIIYDTVKENDSIIHIVDSLPKNLSNEFTLIVNEKNRLASSSNHTATHLLHEALRSVLGTHVQQKGSMVSDKYLRFDFSHFSKLSEKEIEEVETLVNQKIIDQIPLEENRSALYKDCINQGVIALFDEKYGETVRSVKFGNSHELCGGTHVSNTSQLRSFIISSESAISTGIRRIEAVSGTEAIKLLFSQSKTLKKVNSILLTDKDPVEAINKIKNQSTILNKKLEKVNNELSAFYLQEIKQKITLIKDLNFCAFELSCDPNILKNLVFKAGKEIENLFLIITSKFEGRAFVVCYVSKNLVASKQMNANLIVKKLGGYIDGFGGGQPFFATASGNNINGITKILKEADSFI
ncbi:MAG: alanine--tRNA ligase [Bacteroidetes bacterium]|jgi:alanyl-tRNA synthetase|nr:MAG: alanine--tRNA ligase [Cryomorphaceae bacterium BACL29 MAG-121220-bin8]MDA0757522.1 alanine--tRNA ligase [Bacteroidota bacterium]MDA0995310.1 alanine--tRNA ligase [Pseudomonadota bacterium]|tara:strand:+ start:3970 stop:6579 length:2610 start_codon:yes stop_codon:yes gene_type:complete